jgi:hypothetical protein
MVKSVVREHHWSPFLIGDLYLDKVDHLGLEYWYEDVKEVSEKIAEKYKK